MCLAAAADAWIPAHTNIFVALIYVNTYTDAACTYTQTVALYFLTRPLECTDVVLRWFW